MSAWRARIPSTNASYAGSAAGSKTVAISISPRRRQVVISSRSSAHPVRLDREQRLRDLRLRHAVEAEHPRLERARAGQQRAQRRRRDRHGPHRAQLAGRSRQHDDERPAVPLDDEAGRGPDRLEDRGAARDHRLLAVPGPHRLLAVGAPAGAVAAQDREDPLLQGRVEHHLQARERTHDLGREVVRGRPEPAGGEDQVDALAGEELERGADVVRAVGDHDDVRQLDAALAQPLGEPGAVAVGDDRRQDLRAGDDDARADAHPQVGRSDTLRGLPPALTE